MAKREGRRTLAPRAQVLGRAAPPYPAPPRPSAHTSGGAGRTCWGRRRGLRARQREVAGGPGSRGRPRRSAGCLQEVTGLAARRGAGAPGEPRVDNPRRAAGRQVSSGEGTAGSGARWGRSRARSVARARRRRCCRGLPGRAPGERGGGARAAPAPAEEPLAPRPQPQGAYSSVWVFISVNSLDLSPGVGVGGRGPFPGLLSDACSQEPWGRFGALPRRRSPWAGRGGQ